MVQGHHDTDMVSPKTVVLVEGEISLIYDKAIYHKQTKVSQKIGEQII